MEDEVAELAGAGRYERSAERMTQRNGYRQRQWDTRVGSLELAIPRLRSGSYFPSFLEPRRRSEQALVAVVAEAYVNGVRTRKVERLVAQLGIESMSRSYRQPPLPQCSTSRCASSASVPSRVATPTSGWTPRWSGSESPAACATRPGRRLRGARERTPRGDRHRRRRGRDRGLLARVPARPGGPRPRWCAALRLRRPRGPEEGDRPGARLPLAALHGALPARHAGPRAQRPSSRWSPPPSARSSPPRRSLRPARDWPAWSPPLRPRRPRWPYCSRPPRRSCSPSWPSRPSTGRSCARPTRWNASTRRSPAAATWSASTRTTRASSASPGRCCIEQNDEWLVGRRYLSAESLAGLYAAEQARGAGAAGADGTGGGPAHGPMTLTTIRNYTTSGDLTRASAAARSPSCCRSSTNMAAATARHAFAVS